MIATTENETMCLQEALKNLEQASKKLIKEHKHKKLVSKLNNYVERINDITKNIIDDTNDINCYFKNMSGTSEQRGHEWLKDMLNKNFHHYNGINHTNFTNVDKFIRVYGEDGPWSDAITHPYFTYEKIAENAKKEWDAVVEEFGSASLSAEDQAKYKTMLLMYTFKETSYEPYHDRVSSATIDHVNQLVNIIQN
uniref:Uncharacterized protein n=1 Tax=viral metagenome TaxID=1070528 RepID=A0A6C0CTU0_9ZZZZ